MNYNKNFQPKKKIKKPARKTVSFLESLKDLGSSLKTQAKDASLGMGQGTVNQIFGQPLNNIQNQTELKQKQPFSFKDYLRSQEQQTESKQRQQFEGRLRKEKLVFSSRNEEVKTQIKLIQEELKKLAKETQGLSQEIKNAVFNGVVEPGIYHFNFFERIRNLITLVRKQVFESRSWLSTLNHRKKHRQGFYWAQVKKSGTKYMLSQERYTVTQTG